MQVPEISFNHLLNALPTAAYLLDGNGIVLAHNQAPVALRALLPESATGMSFFDEVLPDGQTSELGGAFQAAMDDANLELAAEVEWLLDPSGACRDVHIQLRTIGSDNQRLGLAIISDHTRLKTAERAIAATFGEARDSGMTDAETGLFSRRQFDFIMAIELRRAKRYGHPTALLALECGTVPTSAREPNRSDRLAVRVADAPLQPAEMVRVAEVLRHVTRTTDVLFRFETSRFHLVLTHSDRSGAGIAAQRLSSHLQSLPIIAPGRRLVVRMALTAFDPDDDVADYLSFAQAAVLALGTKLQGQA